MEQTGLTQYEEVVTPEEITEEVVQATNLFDLTRYLESQDVGAILTRSYQIDTLEWSPTQNVYHSLAKYSFPAALFAQPWVKTVLAGFTFFRCSAVQISFRIQSTNMHQGCVCISHVFNEPTGVTDSFRALVSRRFNNRPMLFSAMPGNSQILDVPWNNPVQWCRVRDIEDETFNLGIVDMDVMVPLSSVSGDPTNAYISVFATFLDPEVAGPVSYTAPPLVTEGKKKGTEGNAGKESTSAGESIAKAAKGVASVVSELAAPIDAVIDLGSSILPLAALVLDKPTSAEAPDPIVSSFGLGQLDTAGVSTDTTFGAHQLSMLSQQAGAMGPDVPNPTLLSCLQTPGIIDVLTVSETMNQHSWGLSTNAYFTDPVIPAEGENWTPTFTNYFSNPFEYWRGSISYQFFFFCSTFTSARVRFTWTPEVNTAQNITDQEGNIMSKVVEIRGDTHTTVTVPYMKAQLWSRVPKAGMTPPLNEYSNGRLQLDLIHITSVASAPTIGMVVYKHAGPDFRVGRYMPQLFETSTQSGQVSRKYVTEGDGEAFNTSVWSYCQVSDPIFPSVGAQVLGFAQPEEYTDICSLLKRFHVTEHTNNPGSGTFLPPTMSFYLNGSRDPVRYLLSPFKYFRGSCRAQFVRGTEIAQPLACYTNRDLTLYGNPGTTDLVVRANLPWYSMYPFETVNHEGAGRFQFGTAGIAGAVEPPGTLLWAMGDDVGVSAMFSPPALNFVTNP